MKNNRTLYRLGILCLFATVCFNGKAQNVVEDSVLNLGTKRYLTLGLGSSSVALNDEHMSPLNYYGGAIYLQVGAFKRKKKSLRNFTFGATYSSIGPRKDERDIDPMVKIYG